MLCGLCTITMAVVVLSTCWPSTFALGCELLVPMVICSFRVFVGGICDELSSGCLENKNTLTYCIYICCCYAAAKLVRFCGCVALCCWYAVVVLLLCRCCFCWSLLCIWPVVVMLHAALLLCCCVVAAFR